MRARISLRIKLLVITVIPLLALVGAALWTTNRSVTRQADLTIHDDLRRSSAVFENMLASRARALEVSGEVIVRDPRFFSVLTLPGSDHDPQLRATVGGVARDFNAITESDLFEVFDARGHRLASAGRDGSPDVDARALLAAALAGGASSGVIVGRTAHYQASITPVFAGGNVVGALLLGARLGRDLAGELRDLTRSEVTFVSGRSITGSTLEDGGDRDVVLGALDRMSPGTRSASRGGTLLKLHSPGHTWLTLVREIPRAPIDGRQYYVMQRALDVETAFLRETQTGLLELGIAAAIAALLAGLLIADRITAPLQRMVRGAEEMERGNYDYPLEIRSRDEIGYLAERFQDMRQQQRAYVSSLQEVARQKSEFIAVASHELRTPITIIRGFQELMADDGLGPMTPSLARAVEGIGEAVETLTRIADDTTRMAQIEHERLDLDLDACDVARLVADAIDAARSAAPQRRVALSSRVDPALPHVILDGPRITQAITHLVTNGIRFTPDGGSVDVHAATRGPALVFEVRDTGVGITPDQQRNLFERRFAVRDSLHHHSSSTLEFNSAGLGLGLPIARGIVREHGGTIRVESEAGRGSTFIVTLPLEVRDRREAA